MKIVACRGVARGGRVVILCCCQQQSVGSNPDHDTCHSLAPYLIYITLVCKLIELAERYKMTLTFLKKTILYKILT